MLRMIVCSIALASFIYAMRTGLVALEHSVSFLAFMLTCAAICGVNLLIAWRVDLARGHSQPWKWPTLRHSQLLEHERRSPAGD